MKQSDVRQGRPHEHRSAFPVGTGEHPPDAPVSVHPSTSHAHVGMGLGLVTAHPHRYRHRQHRPALL